MANVPGVSEWFSKKNVLITGGTGFIGKSVLEKLLRSCPDVGTIYMLLREKKGQSVESRMDILKKSEIFSLAPINYDWSKVRAISGDPSKSGCDLEEDVVLELKEKVNIIYHVAATIRFDERLINAININVRMTYDMVQLAKNMKNLMVFIHVSTAFSNSDRTIIEEKVYPPLLDWRKILNNWDRMKDGSVDAVTVKIIGRHPNTYTFTKQMAENLVWDHRHEIPIVIFRPVVVTSTMYEPAVGWSDNFSGAETWCYLLNKGVLRALYMEPDHLIPHCPGDVTANTAVVAAWKVGCHAKIRQEKHEEVICSNYWLTSMGQAFNMATQAVKVNPISNALWTPYFVPCTNDISFLIGHIFLNLVPAILFQIMARVAGKKVMMENHVKLYNALSEEDKKKFNLTIFKSGNIEPEDDELREYITMAIVNISRFMGDPKIPREVGQRQQKIMKRIDTACRILLIASAAWFFPYQRIEALTLSVIDSLF